MQFSKKDILDMESLSAEEIHLILDTAENMKEISHRAIKKVPTLRGKTVVLFFSTSRHPEKAYFEIAAKRLSADCVDMGVPDDFQTDPSGLVEMINGISALNPDVLVMERPYAGGAKMVAPYCRFSVINAGDGAHAHPSQTLLDMLAVRETKGEISGLKVAMVGDIRRSPAAKSNCMGFTKMGAEVVVAGPAPMVPPAVEALGVSICRDAERAVSDADVVIVTNRTDGHTSHNADNLLKAFLHQVNRVRNRLILEPKPPLFITHGDIHPTHRTALPCATRSSHHAPIHSGAAIAVHMAQLYLLAGGVRSAATD